MAWTDERMDDLVERMDAGFARVDGDIRDLRAETRSEFAAVRSEMHAGFADVRSEMRTGFAELRSMMFRFGLAMIVVTLGLIATVVAAIVSGAPAG